MTTLPLHGSTRREATLQRRPPARGRATGWLSLAAALVLPHRAQALDPDRAIDQYAHERWTTKDGLPEGSVLALHQSAAGDLWLGTQCCLVRFDGLEFTQYADRHLGLRQHSFGRDLLETADGTIWAALVGGVARFDGNAFSFFDEQNGLEHPFAYALAPAGSAAIWVGTGGTGVWRLAGERFSPHPAYDDAELPGKVNDLAVDRQQRLWVATDQGLVSLGREVQRFGIADGLPSAVVNVVLASRKGDLWVGTRGGLCRRSGSAFEPLTMADGLGHDDVTALLEDRAASLWIGTQDGSLHRWRDGQVAVAINSRPRNAGGIFALTEDRDGALWVGTGEGLERYRDGAFVTAGRAQGFQDERLLNLTSRHAGGLWVLDGSGSLLVYDQGEAVTVAPPGTVSGEGMLGLVESAEGDLFIGGQDLTRFRDGVLETFPQSGGEFTVLVADKSALLVAQTASDGRSQLSRFQDGTFTPVPVQAELRHVQRLLRDRSGRLWISTGGSGLVRVSDQETRVFRQRDGLPHDLVYGLAEDARGSMWVATRGGLARIRGDVVANLATQPRTPHRSPVHVHDDGLGHLWVTADDGIYRLPLAALDALAEGHDPELDARRFATADGLRTVEISWRSSAQASSHDGRLWYATSRGLATVHPERIAPVAVTPRVRIFALLVDDHEVELADRRLVLPGRERLAIHYAAPELSRAQDLLYRYQLVGYDDAWIDAGARRMAFYTNAPAGEYAFRVAARLPGGAWSDPPTELALDIPPRWHETRLARGVATMLALLLLLGIYRLRVRRLRHRLAEEEVRRMNEQLEARVAERTRELNLANQQLADESERLAITLRSVLEGVITTDVEGRIQLMNPVAERLTGLSAEQVTGRHPREVLRLVDRSTGDPVASPTDVVLADDATGDQFQRALLLSTAGEFLIEASAAPITDPEGRLSGSVLVLRDVTERAKVEEQVQKAQKLEAVGILAAGIAHDFNNLLTGVFGHVDLARLTLPKGSRESRWLGEAMSVLDNARHLARQLLTFSSGGRPTTERHSLRDLLRSSTRFVLAGSSVLVDLDLPRDLWACEIDPQQIRQAIDNLVLNARQAMTEGGRLRVAARNAEFDDGNPQGLPPGRYVAVELTDTGPGITPEVCERVFDPFFTTRASGNGLGLATVHSIVSQHHGHIALESRVGAGTTFRLWLPAASGASLAPPAVSLPPPSLSPSGGNGRRVLVMDDELHIRKLTQRALEECGYAVTLAADGDEAIRLFTDALAAQAPFDVVLLDLTVPGGRGGVDTLVGLRALDPTIRAVASSGYSSDRVLSDPASFGFDAVLPKPYLLGDLRAVVEVAMSAGERP